jgi:RNA polymerase sigma factor (sigma-70 family)
LEGSFWSHSNAWWHEALRKILVGVATHADWEEATRQLWQLSRAVEEAKGLIYQDRQHLVQMVLEKLQDAKTIRRVADVDTPAHYLAGVMKNHLINLFTRRKAAVKVFKRYGEESEPSDNERPAADLAAERELQAQVRFIVNHLVSAEDRKLLWGFYRDGLSIEVLAHNTGLSTAAVAKRLSRARKRLRDLYKE